MGYNRELKMIQLQGFDFVTRLMGKKKGRTRRVGKITAPECNKIQVGDSYNKKVDVWDFGLFVLQMLEGFKEFKRGSEPPRVQDVMRWSVGVRDFIALCLTEDPEQRPTTSSLLGHKWLIGANLLELDCFKAIESFHAYQQRKEEE